MSRHNRERKLRNRLKGQRSASPVNPIAEYADLREIYHLEPPSIRMAPPEFGPSDREGGFTTRPWKNDVYYGLLRRAEAGFPIGGGPFAVISITALDETSRHDWREFMDIKNYLVGPTWEAVEIYPTEANRVDPSNRFYLWAFPGGTLTFGLPVGRRVWAPKDGMPPQRPFPD